VTLLISAGGTGGHVFPALALGESLRKHDWDLLFVGRKNSFEENMINKFGFKFSTIPSSGFFGKSALNKLRFLMNLLLAFGYWFKFIWQKRFRAVIVTGGFSSLVPLLGALMLNKPFFLLELNRIPGRITKYFSRFAQEIYLGFPLTEPIKGNFYYSGSPLRKELLNVALANREKPKNNNPTVLVLGGSLGAQALNLAAIELANHYPAIKFVIQTGKRDYDMMKAKIISKNCQLIEFTLTPEENYARASLAITRAGGMVLSELLAFGIPSIIVPFPFATDRHQTANAQFLEKAGAAIILDQDNLPELDNIFEKLISDKEQLEKMSDKARRIAKNDAADKIAERITRCLAS
jgi:UDP-N-acetylglucosamine--N-acetylmuramyl-(pentapeptide) pyrophosphoryl-undecaprenol N-acetylglucosamine transferase